MAINNLISSESPDIFHLVDTETGIQTKSFPSYEKYNIKDQTLLIKKGLAVDLEIGLSYFKIKNLNMIATYWRPSNILKLNAKEKIEMIKNFDKNQMIIGDLNLKSNTKGQFDDNFYGEPTKQVGIISYKGNVNKVRILQSPSDHCMVVIDLDEDWNSNNYTWKIKCNPAILGKL